MKEKGVKAVVAMGVTEIALLSQSTLTSRLQ